MDSYYNTNINTLNHEINAKLHYLRDLQIRQNKFINKLNDYFFMQQNNVNNLNLFVNYLSTLQKIHNNEKINSFIKNITNGILSLQKNNDDENFQNFKEYIKYSIETMDNKLFMDDILMFICY